MQTIMQGLSRAKGIKPNSTIGIITTGSPTEPNRFDAGINELHRRGFRVHYPLDPRSNYGSSQTLVSATARERADALMSVVANPEISIIIAARGGYGCNELLPFIDFSRIRAGHKLIVGYSDVTPLLVATFAKAGIPSIHGPTIAREFADAAANPEALESIEILLRTVTEPSFTPSYSCEILRKGNATGTILAGNLTMLCTLLGTPWDVSYDGCVLVLEDVNEAAYRIHRALTQLRLAGKLNKLAAVVFGRFSEERASPGPSVSEVIRQSVDDIFAGTRFPVLSGLPFGHNGKNISLPVGCRAEVREGTFRILESPIG